MQRILIDDGQWPWYGRHTETTWPNFTYYVPNCASKLNITRGFRTPVASCIERPNNDQHRWSFNTGSSSLWQLHWRNNFLAAFKRSWSPKAGFCCTKRTLGHVGEVALSGCSMQFADVSTTRVLSVLCDISNTCDISTICDISIISALSHHYH